MTPSPETRKKISERRAETALRAHHEAPPLTEGYKRCNQCGRQKYWNADDRSRSEFPIYTKRHKHFTSRYPAAHCRDCRNAERRKRLAGELPRQPSETTEHRRKRDRRWRDENREEIRAKHREWSAAQRREEGRPVRGPWAKYQERALRVPGGPFLRFIFEEILPQNRHRFDRESTRSDNSISGGTGMPRSSTRKFDEVNFDAESFAAWLGLTKAEWEKLRRYYRLLKKDTERKIELTMIERVLIELDTQERLDELAGV